MSAGFPLHELKPRLVVVGVGGAGGNAINNMIEENLEGVEFVVANTDAQALTLAKTQNRLQLGVTLTAGLGAGADPSTGRRAAEESLPQITEFLKGAHMVFVAAGMGGGTGTGAAPVIAKAAREMGILAVGVVTRPFQFEGTRRSRIAEEGIHEFEQQVDTLIVIPNQNLFRLANERTTFVEAFKLADQVLYSGVRGVTDLMVKPGLINLDFADVRAVMAEMGKAMMGTGEGEGPRRALDAAYSAITNPLLDDVSMKGAKGVLINITGGMDMTLFEVDEAANAVREEVDPNANIILGSTFDETLAGKIRVSVVATGIEVAPRGSNTLHRRTADFGRDDLKLSLTDATSLKPSSEPMIKINLGPDPQAMSGARPSAPIADEFAALGDEPDTRNRPSFKLFGWARSSDAAASDRSDSRPPSDREPLSTPAEPIAKSPTPAAELESLSAELRSDPRHPVAPEAPLSTSADSIDDEDLEIPAFLRRQMK